MNESGKKALQYPWIDFALATLIYLVALAFVCPFGNFPLNDDWVYSKDIFMSLNQGHPVVTGLESAWGAPQLLLGYFLSRGGGVSHCSLRLIGIGSTLICTGLLATFLKSQARLVRILALLCFYFFPPLFVVSATFMTDMPFLFLWVLALLAFENAFRRLSYGSFLAAAALTILAILQRQFGALIPVAAFALLAFTEKIKIEKPKRRTFLVILAILALLPLPISKFWSQMGVGYVPRALPHINPLRILKDLQATFFFLSFGFLPLALLEKTVWTSFRQSIPTKKNIRTWSGFLSSVLILTTIFRALSGSFMPYFGNQLSNMGMFQNNEILAGVRPELLWGAWKFLFTLAGLFSSLVLVGRLCGNSRLPRASDWKIWSKKFRSTPLKPNEFFYITSLFCFSYTIARTGMFDRYMLPLVPAFLVWLSSQIKPQKKTVLVASAAFILVAAYSATTLYDYFRWNEARWTMAQEAVNQGAPPTQIEAGYEWVGWYRKCFEAVRDIAKEQYVVSSSPLSGFEIWKAAHVESLWPPGASLYLLKRPEGFVPTPHAECK